jgi:hypothetical protein
MSTPDLKNMLLDLVINADVEPCCVEFPPYASALKLEAFDFARGLLQKEQDALLKGVNVSVPPDWVLWRLKVCMNSSKLAHFRCTRATPHLRNNGNNWYSGVDHSGVDDSSFTS